MGPYKMNIALSPTSVVLVLALLLTSLAHGTTAQKSNYGESCNKTLRCDSRAFLNCYEETCGCLKPEEMVFEPRTGKCRTKASEQCKQKIETTDGQVAYEIQPCVEDSICDQEGFCSCNEYYAETENGTCSPSQDQRYNERCDAKLQCSTDFGLQCDGRFCKCNSLSTFSSKEGHCVGLAGSPCVQSACTNNANCTEDGTCECNDGYFKDSSGKCAVGFGDRCESTDICLLGLVCRDNTCSCRYSDVQTYSESRGKCVSTVGDPCNDNVLCADHAQCVGTKCVCMGGYVRSFTDSCELSYGQRCNGSTSCDSVAKLACIDGVCHCDNFGAYRDRKCLKLVGAKCNTANWEVECFKRAQRQDSFNENEVHSCLHSTQLRPSECGLNSYCKSLSIYVLGQGICTCRQGSTEDATSSSCQAVRDHRYCKASELL